MSSSIIHTSGYCFKKASPEWVESRRVAFLAQGKALGLRGTILLGAEGINMMLAGTAEAVAEIQSEINTCYSTSIMFKDSVSQTQPFNRFLVKVKKEVVTMGVEDLDVSEDRAPYVSPTDLKRWLDAGHDDEGRPVMIIDTRNDYEVRLGTFEGAVSFDIRHFREFPAKIDALNPRDYDNTAVVTCCTGGIRCEKGAPYMVKRGFKNVSQLEGGLLNFFKECGDSHWQGDCFVFDHRVALDAQMNETQTKQCFACRMPVTHQEQALPSYVFGEQCPHCCE